MRAVKRFSRAAAAASRAVPASVSRVRGQFSRQNLFRFATGGDWAVNQPAETRRNLIWFWFDGFFASASDNIVVTYLTVYLLTLGASQGQIGMLSSLSSLSAALMLLPGAFLVERLGHRRGFVLLGGGLGRVAILLLAISPLLLKGPALVTFAIAFSVMRDAMNNLSYPAWMSLTGDIVPLEGRGRYFASRNFIMAVMGMAATLGVGLLITRFIEPVGYQVSLGLAFGIGCLAFFSFARLVDKSAKARPAAAALPAPQPAPALAPAAESVPAAESLPAAESVPAAVPARRRRRIALRLPRIPRPPSVGPAVRAQLADIFSHREFVVFAAVTAIWNFSINIAGPFFTVVLVQNLHADSAMVGLTSIASSLAAIAVQRRVGVLNDRWGSHRLTVISGLLIPLVPLFWVFIDSAWYVIPINILSGALWAGYNLGSFNYLLTSMPQESRARYSAIFQVVVTLSLAAGAAVGSLVVTHIGYTPVFFFSAVGRLIAALLFAWLSGTTIKALRLRRRPAQG